MSTAANTGASVAQTGPVGLVDFEPISNHRFEVAESPVFDDRRKLAFFIDIWGRLLVCYDPCKRQIEVRDLPDMPGFVALSCDDRLILGLGRQIVAFDWVSGQMKTLAELDLSDEERINDGCPAPDGSLVFGTMRIAADLPVGRVQRLFPDGRIEDLGGPFCIPNGPTFDFSGGQYLADSATGQIWHSVSVAAPRKLVHHFPAQVGKPDGMACDTDGRLWCALWDGGAIAAIAPGVAAPHLIRCPASYVTALGPLGAEGAECLVTTAARPLLRAGLPLRHGDGNVFRARLRGSSLTNSLRTTF